MKRAVLLVVFGLAFFVASDRASARPAQLLEILTGFSAKETCSCVFLADQTDEYCKSFGTIDGLPTELTIDREAQTVTSKFDTVTRVARMSEAGCQNDALP